MTAVCIYLQIHQPWRVKKYQVFSIGHDHNYFNDTSDTDLNNERILHKVTQKSYLPTTELLLNLLTEHPEFKLALSISGVALEQFEQYAPFMIDRFKELLDTGRVELLSETYYHSLAFFYSRNEFEHQVARHGDKLYDLFGITPRVFRNTELAYTNALGAWADKKGYDAVLAEGWDFVLDWRSPNFVYQPPQTQHTKLLLKNYQLSDDIAFRFSETARSDTPLTAETFAHWISSHNGSADTINLFMDFETFGEHQWEDTGIFEFLKHLPGEILKHPDNIFLTPSEVTRYFPSRDTIDVPHVLTWADTERDLSAWTGNDMQTAALRAVYTLEDAIRDLDDPVLTEDWRKLQTSDHFYYMCTKWFADGDVHAYFNPYESPYDAFIAYMNVLKDLKLRIETAQNNGTLL